jgi:hypothetical protein
MNIDHPPDRPTQPGNDSDVGNSVGMGIGSGAAPRLELLEAVKYSIGWTERRVRCGETNVKGYILFSALLCQAQALQRGASDAEVEQSVLTVVGDELNRCLLLLQDAAGRDPSFATNGGEVTHEKKGSGWGAAWGPEDAVSANAVEVSPLRHLLNIDSTEHVDSTPFLTFTMPTSLSAPDQRITLANATCHAPNLGANIETRY